MSQHIIMWRRFLYKRFQVFYGAQLSNYITLDKTELCHKVYDPSYTCSDKQLSVQRGDWPYSDHYNDQPTQGPFSSLNFTTLWLETAKLLGWSTLYIQTEIFPVLVLLFSLFLQICLYMTAPVQILNTCIILQLVFKVQFSNFIWKKEIQSCK